MTRSPGNQRLSELPRTAPTKVGSAWRPLWPRAFLTPRSMVSSRLTQQLHYLVSLYGAEEKTVRERLEPNDCHEHVRKLVLRLLKNLKHLLPVRTRGSWRSFRMRMPVSDVVEALPKERINLALLFASMRQE